MTRTVPLKHLAAVAARIGWHGLSTEDYLDEGDLLIPGTAFDSGAVQWEQCQRVAVEIWARDPAIQVAPDDVLITKDGTIGKVAHVRELPGRATLNSGVFRVTPRAGVIGRFLFWVFQSRLMSDFVDLLRQGSTIDHLYQKDLVGLRVPFPPLHEQRAIANYLDAETARIEWLVSTRRKQLALVRARTKQAVAGMIDAGGAPRVPLRRVADLLPGFAYRTEDFRADDRGVRLLRGINVDVGRVRWDDLVRVDQVVATGTATFALAAGDVVLGMDRPVISTGVRIAQLTHDDVPALLVQRVARLRARPDLSQDYLYLALRVGDLAAHFEPMFTGVSVPHVSPDQILDYEIPFPSRPRQEEIVLAAHRLSDQAHRYELAVQMQIDRLVERRQALITTAVTGALEIPGVAA